MNSYKNASSIPEIFPGLTVAADRTDVTSQRWQRQRQTARTFQTSMLYGPVDYPQFKSVTRLEWSRSWHEKIVPLPRYEPQCCSQSLAYKLVVPELWDTVVAQAAFKPWHLCHRSTLPKQIAPHHPTPPRSSTRGVPHPRKLQAISIAKRMTFFALIRSHGAERKEQGCVFCYCELKK